MRRLTAAVMAAVMLAGCGSTATTAPEATGSPVAIVLESGATCPSAAPCPTPAPCPTCPVCPTLAPTPRVTQPPRPTPTPTPAATPVPSWAELKESAQTVPYKTLFRDSDEYIGDTIYFRGEVIQVLDNGSDDYDLRVNVTLGEYDIWKDTVYLVYHGKRVIQDDIVQFVGTYLGPYTYESVGAGSLTIPAVQVIRLVIEK